MDETGLTVELFSLLDVSDVELEIPVEELEVVAIVVLRGVTDEKLLLDEVLEAVLSEEDVEDEELELLLDELLDVIAALLVELVDAVEDLELSLVVLDREVLEGFVELVVVINGLVVL